MPPGEMGQPVLAVLLAIGAASSWGLSAVLVRRGLRDLSTAAGTLISLTSGLVGTSLLAAAVQREALFAVSWRALALFGLIGVLNFSIGRFFDYLAIARLGVARSTPLLATSPLFAVLIAVLLTGEQVTVATGAGIALILVGVFVTITAPREGATSDEAAVSAPAASRRALVTGVLSALAAALSYGSSQVITRQVVGELAPPLAGSAIALFWGTLGFAVLSARNLGARGAHLWRGVASFGVGGLISATGVLLMFFALSQGEVVVVSPVLATTPLFTLLFAALLLRGVERITPRIIAGAMLVVAGVAILSVF